MVLSIGLLFFYTIDDPDKIADDIKQFFSGLLMLSVVFSVAVYPLAIYLTKPLEKLTRKTVEFSLETCTNIQKNDINKDEGDEISKLNRAFSYMEDELRAMLEAKKELILYVAHELGTPLSRINVAVEIIEEQLEEGKNPSIKTVQDISRNIKEMSVLLKELLDLSRMDTKDYKLDIKPSDVEKILDEVIDSFKIMTERQNITIDIRKEGHLHDVPVDPEKISRVLYNILSNAIKYSPRNGKIDVILKREGENFSVSVKDNGQGILKENAEKIFEPFFREDPSRTRKTGGTGLGLAITRKIISLHGGSIGVENPGEPGAIITFKI
ncbi:MAG: HAMP domain-containing sensor histidine kinase [Candidatus Eremiobacterota bacterium]